MKQLRLIAFALFAAGTSLAAQDEPPTDDPRWKQAQAAYRDNDNARAITLLVALVDDHPGDVDLAVTCWETILRTERTSGSTNHWIRLASERLMSLERIGAISANTSTARSAFDTVVDHGLREGRYFEVLDLANRVRAENPHDLFWRLRQARVQGSMDLRSARPLYEKLKEDRDPVHPDGQTRERWIGFESELNERFNRLPKEIVPLPEGSPLLAMEPDDPDGRWRRLLDRSPATIPGEIDRLMAQAFGIGQVVLWQDMSGLTDPPRALDLHLLAQPAAELAPLRSAQEESLELEVIPAAPAEAQVLALARRFPWARSAQQLLLNHANKSLWDGRVQSALRSFHELLNHADDAALKDAAQVGYWTALAQTGGFEEINGAPGRIDPGKKFRWMGKQATAAEIRNELLAARPSQPREAAPSLQGLDQHVLNLPPVSPWPTESRSGSASIDLQVAGDTLLVSGRNVLIAFDTDSPGQPRWSQLQRHPAEENRRLGFHPGYFRPLLDDHTIYTRWGMTSLPSSLAAFDRRTGEPLWSNGSPELASRSGRKITYQYSVPTGDPAAADGCLYYLQWDTERDVNDRRGRSLSLVCFDPVRKARRWKGRVADAGQTTDIVANFERATAQFALYGNSVTVHRGAVYCNSNAGLIARMDVRDGRLDWMHFYRRGGAAQDPGNLGCEPLVAGDNIICMPRDARRVFALDQETGRVVWDNPVPLPVEMLGLFEDSVIVRGRRGFASLDSSTGETRWLHPFSGTIAGRSALIGPSIVFGDSNELHKIDARTGRLEESRPWNLGGERPLGFAIQRDRLFVVSDKPTADPREKLRQPLAADAPVQAPPLSLPFKRTWSLPRGDALVAIPQTGSPLDGRIFVLSGGILECLEGSPRGAILWQRFLSTHNTSLSFSAHRLLLNEGGRGAGLDSRVIAIDGKSGEVLWESPRPREFRSSLQFGSTLLFSDARGRLVALDLETGRLAWDRNLGESQLLVPAWDGEHLQVFHSSFRRGAHHFVLDPESGQTLARHQVQMHHLGKESIHGQPAEDGYIEISFNPTEARYVRLTALSEINGRGWASAAELHLVGTDGERLPRTGWKVEALHETESNRNPLPEKLIDGDPDSWWHTPWLRGIPEHPHPVTIDLGSKQTVTGLRYLPAVIINNNGMIRDYQFSASLDGQDWGEPVAQGVMVNRIRVDRAFFAGSAVWFEARNSLRGHNSVFRYEPGSGPALTVVENARLHGIKGPYVLLSQRNAENKESLHVIKAADPTHRFELSPVIHPNRAGDIVIEGDRLFLAERELVLADLAAKKFLILPTDERFKDKKQGTCVRLGPHRILKIVRRGNDQDLLEVNLETGEVIESTMKHDGDTFQSGHFHRPPSRRYPAFGSVFLYYDRSILSAWIAAE